MVASVEVVTRSERSVEDLFDRARSIDLHTESQAAAGERAVGGVVSGRIGLGEEVTWQARHFGVRLRLTSRITAFDAPHSFTDEQTRGPFRSFRHEHRFEPDGSGSVMTDRLTFRAPFGVLGRVAERLVLARHLRRLLEERGAFLAASPAPGDDRRS
ncbi:MULTISPECIES: SRPBCC family protein [unclassified Rathayibacter]|uniref:SRPBCC family protein n=1 Tax=unclassified Rathayibacter TaxID=2609250 RepID=UPI000F4CB377|nr:MULTISPECIES: SRPBCC family protein [unclassified Rathayibacter]ROP48105.1 polyketide cyclase/dehydrase/lipid transport protein [Rathayibacter sp. PhB186]ROS48709.1 polyketide cyclase/dehydrase/lipid transport protein [Rathayibacter sp. PhB185]